MRDGARRPPSWHLHRCVGWAHRWRARTEGDRWQDGASPRSSGRSFDAIDPNHILDINAGQPTLGYNTGLTDALTGLLPAIEHCTCCGWNGPYEELADHDACRECGEDGTITTSYGFGDEMRPAYEFTVEWLVAQLSLALQRTHALEAEHKQLRNALQKLLDASVGGTDDAKFSAQKRARAALDATDRWR